jgi:hypothetical protein
MAAPETNNLKEFIVQRPMLLLGSLLKNGFHEPVNNNLSTETNFVGIRT